jgi:hypothetical protein
MTAAVATAWARSPPRGSHAEAVVAFRAAQIMKASAGRAT